MPTAEEVARAYTREYDRKYKRKRRAERRNAFFEGKACIDCGSTENLELDHRNPVEKASHHIWFWGEDRLAAETAKCDIRCHACHKERHREISRERARERHGTITKYKEGCRCQVCVERRQAKRVASRERKYCKYCGTLLPEDVSITRRYCKDLCRWRFNEKKAQVGKHTPAS